MYIDPFLAGFFTGILVCVIGVLILAWKVGRKQ